MKPILLILSLFAFCHADTQFCANCYKFNNYCHTLDYLFDIPGTDWGVFTKIGLLRSNQMLVYSYLAKARSQEVAKTGFVKLDKPEINGIVYTGRDMHFMTFEIDQENELIYLGAADGIYVLTKDNMLSLAGASNKGQITEIAFVNNHLYYQSSRNQSHTINRVPNPGLRITSFVITRKNITVFLANTDILRLYVTNGRETVVISEKVHKGLVKDVHDVVYTWTDENVYKVTLADDLNSVTLKQILDIPGIDGLTFDNSNNAIFNVGRALFKLTKTEQKTCTKTYFMHCSV